MLVISQTLDVRFSPNLPWHGKNDLVVLNGTISPEYIISNSRNGQVLLRTNNTGLKESYPSICLRL
jgi:hypothetical protein